MKFEERTAEEWYRLAEYRWRMVMEMHDLLSDATEDYKCDAPIGLVYRTIDKLKRLRSRIKELETAMPYVWDLSSLTPSNPAYTALGSTQGSQGYPTITLTVGCDPTQIWEVSSGY